MKPIDTLCLEQVAAYDRINDVFWAQEVTAENINDIREQIGPCDQRDEVREGDIITHIRFSYGGGSVGALTVWLNRDRGAIEVGGDSDWGDWNDNDDVGQLVSESAIYQLDSPSRIVEYQR